MVNPRLWSRRKGLPVSHKSYRTNGELYPRQAMTEAAQLDPRILLFVGGFLSVVVGVGKVYYCLHVE